MAASFFFYDYETTGIDSKLDRIIQFAGIRTDENFNPIAEPIAHYCKLSPEIIPNPEALLVTGIDYHSLQQQGLNEIEFMHSIYQEFARPNTCVAGYNNIRFDDEFTRFSFYRNFYDAYAREWQNNNSRWDLIDVVRMCAALRPKGITWPKNPEGKISFKLEELSKANGLKHEHAHDALSDVYATIALAKLIQDAQPKLLKYLLNCRKKNFVSTLMNFDSDDLEARIIVHSSAMISGEFYATSAFLPLMIDTTNQNSIIAWDLRYEPQILFDVNNDVEKAKYLLYTAQNDLKPGEQRLALKNIFINKVPAIAPFSTLDAAALQRTQLEKELIKQRAKQLLANKPLWFNFIKQVYSSPTEFITTDVDQQLYNKFISPQDKYLVNRLHITPTNKLYDLQQQFSDERLVELLFRYRARHYPDTLSEQEQQQWINYCQRRLNNEQGIASISKAEFIAKTEDLLATESISAKQRTTLESWLNVIKHDELAVC